jgi:uncharacterized zinc-type alcohol dehydrogenase-like protein
VNTVSADIDIDAYMSLLRLGGVMATVGAPTEAMSLNAWSVLRNRRSIAGSLIGSVQDTQDMLDFCAEHGIGAEIEMIPINRIDEAFDRMLASDVRYRFVVDIESLSQ